MTRPIPDNLLEQCKICLEEKLFSQAFSFLNNLLSAPSCVPPPPFLSLAVTIAIHPAMTTRTDSTDRHESARDALRYLHNIASVGDSGLKEALKFGNSHTARVKRAKGRISEDEEGDTIRSQYAGKQSLFNQAEDFWAVVGWAFNCSVRHQMRWGVWKLWLEWVLNVMEKDLHDAPPHTTLIAQYMMTVGSGRNNKRRVMRAVTADGSVKSMGEFPAIWENETRPVKVKEMERKKLDLENDEYGDYLVESDEDDPLIVTRTRRGLEEEDDQDDDQDNFGGLESIQLRQRFLSLLTQFSRVAPSLFVDTEELFALFTEFIRPLPVDIFQHFVLPLQPYLDVHLHASLVEMLYRPLIGKEHRTGLIDQAEFERSFADCTAINSNVADNAKVSLLTESLLRALWISGNLGEDLSELQELVKDGIEGRNRKAGGGDGRRRSSKRSDIEEAAKVTLHCSGERINVLLMMMNSGGGMV
jgi:hypothetical protein